MRFGEVAINANEKHLEVLDCKLVHTVEHPSTNHATGLSSLSFLDGVSDYNGCMFVVNLKTGKCTFVHETAHSNEIWRFALR